MRRLALALIAALALAGCGTSQPKGHAASGIAATAHQHPQASVNAPPATLRRVTGRHASLALAPVPAEPVGAGSGWHWVYADAFAAQIGSGSGQDSTWKANEHSQGCCSNGNEIAYESPSLAQTSSNGLELLCRHESFGGKPNNCSGVDTYTPNGFKWKPNGGQSFAFTVQMQLPPRDLGEDPGWWATDPQWTDELDYLEGWEWNHEEYYGGIPVWKAQIGGCGVSHEAYKLLSEIPRPETEMHTYTTVVKASGEEEEVIDGHYRWSLGKPCGINTPWMHLILTHALREATHLTGTSIFSVRYVAVYEQGSGGIEHGGLAPGTTIAGSNPPPPPPPTETTPPPPPPTETTPPPPVEASLPHAPSGCASTGHREGTTSWVSIACSANPSADAVTKYRLYRTAPQQSGRTPGAVWTEGVTPIWSNHILVTQNERYCYFVSAINAKGESSLSAPTCVRA